MLENDLKNKRKCSVCRQAGHNKKRCPELLETENKNSARKSPVVPISVGKLHKRSPHVVDLRTEKKEDLWGQVNVYQDNVKKEERRVVDFAQMVKKANKEQGERNKSCLPAGMEKVITQVQIEEIIDNGYVDKKKKISARLPKLNIIYHLSSIINLPKKMVVTTGQKVTQATNNTISAFSPKRFAYSIIVFLLLITAPFPAIGYYNQVKDTGNRVIEESTNAFLSLQSSTVAVMHSNLDQAQYDLNSALESFNNANSILEREHRALQFVAGVLPVIGLQIKSRQHLLTAGHHLALGNTYLVKGVGSVEDQPDLVITEKIKILADHFRGAILQYNEALLELSGVDSKTVPVEYQQSFEDFKLLFTAFVGDMQDLLNLSDSVITIFGDQEFRRYLLVFQNNNEIRPTGGFMGSFAILDMQKGRIVNLDIPGGGTYDLQGQLDKYIEPPLPLQLVNDRWEFQDSNWFPDFPASAKKMAWFYEQGRGASVDGVIAINATVLERVLKIFGPVVNEEHGLEIASQNALEELQYEVDVDYDKEKNQPKEVIGDLADEFLNRLGNLNAVSGVQILSELNEALEQKEIQVYFNDLDIQDRLASFNWTGGILPITKTQDYLFVVNANIGGQKSDAKIKQKIEHQSVIDKDGSIIDTVVVYREHSGQLGQRFYGVNNIDFIRIYVPEGAELLEAGGFSYPPEDIFHVPESWYEDDLDVKNYEQEVAIHAETGTRITNEFGRTSFGNWMMVMPGETSNVYFKYRLPFKLNLELEENNDKWEKFLQNIDDKKISHYSLVVQKQSGVISEFLTRIICPVDWKPVWQSDDKMKPATNGVEFTTNLLTDEVVGLVMQKVEN
ncbi:DUF4012 domain-containing protein [Patescibacteria group bacterium]|nr:DUF4012 domain-containing protein [Patescibacteria group bacterium]